MMQYFLLVWSAKHSKLAIEIPYPEDLWMEKIVNLYQKKIYQYSSVISDPLDAWIYYAQ